MLWKNIFRGAFSSHEVFRLFRLGFPPFISKNSFKKSHEETIDYFLISQTDFLLETPNLLDENT